VTRLAWLAVFGLSLAACGASLGPVDERLVDLEANQARWDSSGPGSYVYGVERLCFCGVEYRGPVRVTVVDGSAVEHVYIDSGLVVPPVVAQAFPTVDGLFSLLRSAIEGDAAEVNVTYDPTLGVPLDFWIDYNLMIADEELGIQVTEAVTPTP